MHARLKHGRNHIGGVIECMLASSMVETT
jgi:hypothetical protein